MAAEPIEVIAEKPHIFIERYAELIHQALLCLSDALTNEWDKAKDKVRKVCDIFDDMLREGFFGPEDKEAIERIKDQLRAAVQDKDLDELGYVISDLFEDAKDAVSYVLFELWA